MAPASHFILAVTLFLTPLLSLAQEVVVADDVDEAILIGKSVAFLVDESSSLNFDDILSDEHQNRFVSLESDVFVQPASQAIIWFKIIVKNESGSDLWISAGANAGWYLDFYRPKTDTTYFPPVLTGEMRPASSKEFDANFYWFKLANDDDKTVRTYYLRHQTGLGKEVPLYMGTLEALTVLKTNYDFISAAFIGLILVMILYNLFLAFATREALYWYYIGYLIFTGLVITYANGYPLLKGNFWLENFFFWSSGLTFFTGIFSLKYLQLRSNAPTLNRIVWGLIIYTAILVPIISLFDFPPDIIGNIYHLGMYLFYFLLMYAGISIWIKKKLNGSFYILGWLFMITSYIIFFSTMFGVFEYTIFTRNVIYFGSGFETILFSLALANRLNTLKDEKERAQAQIIDNIKQRNVWLEDRVAERTAEIHHRVKNNLQMISSMLNMQKRRADTVSDKSILETAKHRVKSIGLIYEHLYNQENLTEINIESYVKNLAQMLIDGLHSGEPVNLTCKVDKVGVDVDMAIPIGLILNELVINSIKYAFIDNAKPELYIEIGTEKDWVITVSDNGRGATNDKKGFGSVVINSLLENLNGSINTQSSSAGYQVNIKIPEARIN